MSKTPEELAKETLQKKLKFSPDTWTDCHTCFVYGYDAAKPEWVSVKERLPELFHLYNHYRESNCVLIVVIKESDQQTPIKPYVTAAHFAQFQSEKPMWTACRCSVSGNEVEPNEWSFEQVSHWMPLPLPPEE